MTTPMIMALPGNEAMARSLAQLVVAEEGRIEYRTFPDGEIYLRLLNNVTARHLILVCTLDHPNEKLLSLMFAATTARELGAAKVGLISPYLAYMRQDRRFKSGEAVTSQKVAHLLSNTFDWLITVDPHLHRYRSLAEVYRIPTRAVHAAPLISQWIEAHVSNPVIIGPDHESEQWVSVVAKDARAPYALLDKVRRGDRDVQISLADQQGLLHGRSPIVVDDVVSSGRTMIEAVRLLVGTGASKPVCVAVHGLFADHSDVLLSQAGAQVIASNSIPHATNDIDVGPLLAGAVKELVS